MQRNARQEERRGEALSGEGRCGEEWAAQCAAERASAGRQEARGGELRRGAAWCAGEEGHGAGLGQPAPVSAGQLPRCLLLRQWKEAVKESPVRVEYQCQMQCKDLS